MAFALSPRRTFAALAAAAVICVALAPSGASAKDRHGRNAGLFAGGVLLGGIVAAPAHDREDDFERRRRTEKRWAYDAYGEVYVSRLRVCD